MLAQGVLFGRGKRIGEAFEVPATWNGVGGPLSEWVLP